MATFSITVQFGSTFDPDMDDGLLLDSDLETATLDSLLLVLETKSPITFAIQGLPAINADADASLQSKTSGFNQGCN